MIHCRGSVHLSWLVDSDILLHLVGRVSLLSGREWFGVGCSHSLVGVLWVYLEGEEGGVGEGEARGTDGFCFTYWSFMERVLGSDCCLKLTLDKLQVICQ